MARQTTTPADTYLHGRRVMSGFHDLPWAFAGHSQLNDSPTTSEPALCGSKRGVEPEKRDNVPFLGRADLTAISIFLSSDNCPEEALTRSDQLALRIKRRSERDTRAEGAKTASRFSGGWRPGLDPRIQDVVLVAPKFISKADEELFLRGFLHRNEKTQTLPPVNSGGEGPAASNCNNSRNTAVLF